MAKPVKKKGQKEMEIPVVGLNYRVTPSTLHMMSEYVETTPIPVRLEREPDNVHDQNAIKVIVAKARFKDMHVGYIPRQSAEILAPAIDRKEVLDPAGEITIIDPVTAQTLMTLRFRQVAKTKKGGKSKTKAKSA